MKEELILFETAKLAKEKCFDERCNTYYFVAERKLIEDSTMTGYNNSSFEDGKHISAPTQSLLQKWLRENHEIYVNVTYRCLDSRFNEWDWVCEVFYDGRDYTLICKDSYEGALEQGLIEALKLIQ